MSSGLINIGLTGLKANQTALSTTGNNVTNANTEGYTRQRVDFETTPSQYTGAGYMGTGVNVASITRMTNEFLIAQVRSDSSLYNQIEKLRSNVSQIDSLLADSATGLSPGLSDFFESLQSSSDDPSSIPERQLVLTQADGLINRFNVLYGRLDALSGSINQDMRAQVTDLNALAEEIAQVNKAIISSTGRASGVEPNDLLDKRDQLIRELSEIVSVTVVEQTDGQYNILIGNGQSLVIGSTANSLEVAASDEDPTKMDIVMITGGKSNAITSEIDGGQLGGILEFRDGILQDSYNSMGRIAWTLADTINEQHQLGMDLENNLGGLFFEDINSEDNMFNRVIANDNNATPDDRVIYAKIVDTGDLTTLDYELEFTGPTDNDILVTNAATGEVITRGQLTGFFPSTFEFDGVEITFESGSFQAGDSFIVAPTRFGARDIDLSISRVEEIAFASPIRTEADLGNVGNAVISPGEMLAVNQTSTDSLLPTFEVEGELSPPILIHFLTDNYYEILDNSDPANPVPLDPPMNNELYIPGIKNYIFTADSGQTSVSAEGTDIAQIPATSASPGPFVNGYSAQTLTIQSRDLETGVVTTQSALNIAANSSAEDIAAALSSRNGVSVSAYTIVEVDNFVDDGAGISPTLTINGETLTIPAGGSFGPDDMADLINANSTLSDDDIIAFSDGSTLTIRSLTGKDIVVEVVGDATDSVDINTANAGAPVTIAGGQGTAVGGFVDVRLDEGVRITANNNTLFEQAPVAESTFKGYQSFITGTPQQGDSFTIEYNEGGISDNRNVLAMAELEVTGTIGGGVSTYSESYSQLVEVVGSTASQATLDSETSKALLTQSENRWLEQAGVNLDEEAGRLIQFQAAYNASAQVVSVARQLFDTLLGTFS
ncbi:flagellar hook-associated protein [Hahella sp. CCB-MM4]|uniref:flagellar hook-associated protein FlgK n=1 Tax=Hahella sp. (strain CCB-MM4) TaxID=1926491 RepID=UPI000B9B6DBE|nr:flagellar hook-associated protein FlgK [Hahella sp. CCB-MM4]OZG73852.1 flagellar hook-associated protein [Hahella sp. CCB-MM4]